MSSVDTQQYLICPLTLQLFNEPVTAEDGHTYERKAITEWITQHSTSPITKKFLSINRLTPNCAIKDAVEAFKQQQAQSNILPSVSIADANANADKCQNFEALDVLCRYCGLTQQFSSIKEHQLRCSSNSDNIVPFEIADNEAMFAKSQQTSSSNKAFQYKKTFSFTNPLAHRAANSTTTEERNQTRLTINEENQKHAELWKERRFSMLKNRKIKFYLIILVALILAAIAITFIIYYVKCKEQKRPIAASPSTTSTSTSMMATTSTIASTATMTTILTMTSTLTMATTSTRATTSTMTSTATMTSSSMTISTSTMAPTSSSTLGSTPQMPCASAEWSSTGITITSDLDSPHDIAIDSRDNIIVADTENHRLQKYFTNGTNMTLLTDIKAPSIFIDKYDNIYVTDAFGDEVRILSSNGELITIIDGSNISGSIVNHFVFDGQPCLYVDKNNTVYISDTGNHQVIKYYPNSTSGIVVAGGKGQGPELNQLNTPYGIYVDEINEIGAIYICDLQNHRIQKWLNGANEGITVAANDDQLDSPVSILLQSTADRMVMFISSFSANHVFKWIPYEQEAQSVIAGIGGFGDEANQLDAPRGIKFDKYWNLYVADSGNNRVQKFLFNTSSCDNSD
ncbi:unnamed protein product [Rotaria sp. Silwood1]|nr:unnamed protein product [Rotaria sp. Silwood1]